VLLKCRGVVGLDGCPSNTGLDVEAQHLRSGTLICERSSSVTGQVWADGEPRATVGLCPNGSGPTSTGAARDGTKSWHSGQAPPRA